jgi:NAD(P)-dependent dehydrogenase (short-subunit alcohol dehydrogenase family)
MTHAVYPSLAGKTVVITGGGSGIGEVIVEGFTRQKSRVFFLDVAAAESQALAARVGNGTRFIHCDVTNTSALQRALADIETAAGPVSVLVNNAANDDRHNFEEVTPEYWQQRIDVNLKHLFFAAQAVTAGMKKAGGGSIINMGSVSWHSAILRIPSANLCVPPSRFTASSAPAPPRHRSVSPRGTSFPAAGPS